MVGAFGEALVMDWGIAKSKDVVRLSSTVPSPNNALPSGPETAAGAVVGTPAYMAPEQARGERATERSDVYALGAILCFVVTKRTPFEERNARDILAGKVAGERALPDGSGCPKPLISICRKALANDPVDRYGTVPELSDDIGRFLDGAHVHAHPETLGERTARFAVRHKVILSLFGIYLVVRLALIAFSD